MWVLVGAVQVMAGNKDVVSSSPVEKLKPFNNREVELAESWVKSRENLNLAFLKSLEADRLLHNFRSRPDCLPTRSRWRAGSRRA